MCNTLTTFNGKHCKYRINEAKENKGLSIRGYESACLADLIASCTFENIDLKQIFGETLLKGIYRDNGVIVLNQKHNENQIKNKFRQFQKAAEQLLQ